MSKKATPVLRFGLIGLVLCGILTLSLPAAAAQDEVSVVLSPETQSIDAGTQTTFDIIIKDVDGGGVGAVDISVAVDPTVGNITDASFNHNPGLEEVQYGDDNQQVRFYGALIDTNQSGSITIASVTVEGKQDGKSPVSITVTDVGSEQGVSYRVSGAEDGTLIVGSGGTDTTAPDSEPETHESSQSSSSSSGGDSDGGSADETELTVSETSGDSSLEVQEDVEGSFDVRALSVSPSKPHVGDKTTFNATIENVGSEMSTVDTKLTLNGTVVARDSISVKPSSSKNVNMSTTFESAGTARLYVGSLIVSEQQISENEEAEETDEATSETVQTQSTTTEMSTPQNSTESTVPGFTLHIAVLSVLVGLLANRLIIN
ncbi:CARDB domain-containing protein [Haloferax profundi]|uniref:CARDB domain-containing protein n=1 Tax=Haloferax profundi TaxID=1544718 RepID=UPI0009E84B9E|nr:CARDB domain-containing protein [Haloferax profundi]